MRDRGSGVTQKLIEKRGYFSGYLFVLPAVVLFSLFLFKPFLWTAYISLHKWDGAAPAKTFVGLQNYARLVGDPVFWLSFNHNLIWTALSVIIPVSVGLFLALLISSNIKGRIIFKTVFFMPGIVSFIAVGIIWGWILHPKFGTVNVILRALKLDFIARGWLGDEFWALPSLILSGNWTYYGFCMVIFLAAISGIDPELYDASKMDGANSWQQLWHITLPQLKNTVTFIALFTLTNSFKVFDLVYTMTSGGPGNRTEVIATYLYKQAFKDVYVGYGCTLSVSLTLIILILTVGSLSFRERTAG